MGSAATANATYKPSTKHKGLDFERGKKVCKKF